MGITSFNCCGLMTGLTVYNHTILKKHLCTRTIWKNLLSAHLFSLHRVAAQPRQLPSPYSYTCTCQLFLKIFQFEPKVIQFFAYDFLKALSVHSAEISAAEAPISVDWRLLVETVVPKKGGHVLLHLFSEYFPPFGILCFPTCIKKNGMLS